MPVRGRRPLGSPDARQAVLGAARELFAELGFERTTMRAVAARAGVDPALIYHYFGDKDGLLLAALRPPVDEATVFAEVPEWELLDYARVLRSVSHGSGRFRRRPLRHEPAPASVVTDLQPA